MSQTLKLPSKESIAFASCVVKSKPPDLTIAEYISLLRQHIAKGRRQDTLSSVHRHLDRSAFWRAECERGKAILLDTKHEVAKLRQEIEGLKAKQVAAAPPKKRKRDPERIPAVPAPTRRKERDGAVEEVEISASIDFDDEPEVGDLSDNDKLFLTSLYHVGTMVRNTRQTDHAALTHHLTNAMHVVPEVVGMHIRKQLEDQETYFPNLKAALGGIQRTIRTIFDGIYRVGPVTDDKPFQGQLKYAAIRMFSRLIDGIGRLCVSEGNYVDSSQTASSKPARGRPKKNATTKKDSAIALYANFLYSLMDVELLDPTKALHRDLFEGFSYEIINKVGERLFVSTFGHFRGTDMEAEIIQSIDGDPADGATTLNEMDTQKLIREAPYYVFLLRRLMALAPDQFNGKEIRPTVSNGKRAPRMTLTTLARERLQRTLINCTLGTEGIDENDEFRDFIKRPTFSGNMAPMPKVKDDPKEWFQKEVWQLLGWGILTRDGDL